MDRTTIRPDMCAMYDEEKNQYEINVEMPGMPKESVELKVHESSFMVQAKNGETAYKGVYSFCCPVQEEKVVAKYDNGLLTIEAPLRAPFANAKKISIE